MDVLNRVKTLVGLKSEETPLTTEERAEKQVEKFVGGLKASDTTKQVVETRLQPAYKVEQQTTEDKSNTDSFLFAEQEDAKALKALDDELVKVGLNVLSMRKHIEETEAKAKKQQQENDEVRAALANESFDDLLKALALPKSM
jgi:glutamate synthase domain-containing protein 1